MDHYQNLMGAHALPMGDPWAMRNPWTIHRLPLGYPWAPDGVPMSYLCATHGRPMGDTWATTNGMGKTWATHGPAV